MTTKSKSKTSQKAAAEPFDRWEMLGPVLRKVLGTLAIVAFIVLGPLVIKSHYDDYMLKRHHARTAAVVTERIDDYCCRSDHTPGLRVTYIASGKKHTGIVEVTDKYYETVKLGDEIPILYNPGNASSFTTLSPDDTYDPMGTGFSGFILWVYAIVDIIFLIIAVPWALLYALQYGPVVFKKIVGRK